MGEEIEVYSCCSHLSERDGLGKNIAKPGTMAGMSGTSVQTAILGKDLDCARYCSRQRHLYRFGIKIKIILVDGLTEGNRLLRA